MVLFVFVILYFEGTQIHSNISDRLCADKNENGDVHIAYLMEYAPGYEWCGLTSLSDFYFEGALPKMYVFWVICSYITTYGIAWILSVAVDSSWDRNKDYWNKNKNVL